MARACDYLTMGGVTRPMEVAPDQGYREHALPRPDDEPKRGPLAARAVLISRVVWLAAGILAACLLVGLFVWLWLGFGL